MELDIGVLYSIEYIASVSPPLLSPPQEKKNKLPLSPTSDSLSRGNELGLYQSSRSCNLVASRGVCVGEIYILLIQLLCIGGFFVVHDYGCNVLHYLFIPFK